MRLWGSRFSAAPDSLAGEFTSSVEVDRILALDDVAGSIAHLHALERAGLVTADESAVLVTGLNAIQSEIESGAFSWEASDEDVHLNIEAALEARVGPLAGKLHTGRSRNDQVALDLRLWLRRTIRRSDASALDLELALLERAESDGHAVLGGNTHWQPAQPILLAHHLLAHVEMLERDRGRLADCWRRADRSPLGSGALAGAGFPLDRAGVAAELGLGDVTANSIDAVSDRDFAIEFVAAGALCMTHLSRLAEELTVWAHPSFGWVRHGDAWSTGSSMMPNKRNPDPCELVRARAARVNGHLATLLGVVKGLPLGYQRDLQEDKRPLFDTADVLDASLRVMAGVIRAVEIRADSMRAAALDGFTTATSVADELVTQGVPFRTAHRVVGRLVSLAESRDQRLDELDDEAVSDALSAAGAADAAQASVAELGEAIRRAATLEAAIGRPDLVGGTAPARVHEALRAARQRLTAARSAPSTDPRTSR